MKNFLFQLAVPALVYASTIPSIHRRQVPEGPPVPGKVDFCTETEASGECDWRVVNFGECNPLPEKFVNNTGSFMVAAGAVCYITTKAESIDCVAHNDYYISPPGNTNLYNVQGRDLGHQITSFRCQQCDECQTN